MKLRPVPTGRSGVALPLALFTIVIAAVMITAVFWVARMEQRMGYNSVASTQAFEAAEAGAANILADWGSNYGGMANGDTRTIAQTSVGGNAVYSATVRRLNSVLYLVAVEGKVIVAGQPITRRQVARLVRLLSPEIDPQGALTTRLGIHLTDSAQVDGYDNVPTGWGVTCGTGFPALYGVLDSAGTVISDGVCPGPGCVTGAPSAFHTSSAARMSIYNNFGGVDFVTLAGSADKVLPPGAVVSGTAPSTIGSGPPQCNMADPNNWGDGADPSGRCGNYFPIIYAQGDLTLTNGIGQGVLLVQGDLNLVGPFPFKFFGVVVVQGKVVADRGEIYGALLTASAPGFASGVIGGDTKIKYSHCAVDRSLTGASVADPLRERGWIQLY